MTAPSRTDVSAFTGYACGLCGEEFTSNCGPGDIECTNCTNCALMRRLHRSPASPSERTEPLMRYRVSIADARGRLLVTEDEEEQVCAWVWRTLKHLRENWPPGATFTAEIRWLEKAD